MTSFVQTTPDGTSKTLGTGEVGLVTATGAIVKGSVTMGNADLYNFGLIAAVGAAVSLTASRAYVENHGSLSGGAVATVDGLTGVSFQLALNLVNYGSITSRFFGGAAILTASGNNRISNHGTISAFSSVAIDLRDQVAAAAGAGNHLANTGTIDGARFGAISVQNGATADRLINEGVILGDVSLGASDTVVNFGQISGDLNLGAAGASNLRNFGTIAGNVTTTGLVINTGAISGRLTMGTDNDVVRMRDGMVAEGIADLGGNDTYLLHVDAEIEDLTGSDTVIAWVDHELSAGIEVLSLKGEARLGVGNGLGNTITGNAQANSIDSQDGNDTVFGQGGHDYIFTDGGDDSVDGGFGDDVVDGGGDNDYLYGSHGADTIFGGGGNDTLEGAGSSDVLVGGTGTDSLAGGIEPDVFVFVQILDSVVSAPDVITGFATRVDKIDLSAIDANVGDAVESAFFRAGAFTGVAGQLVLRVAGGSSYLEGDVDGVRGADFSIRLNGVTSLSATDILL